MKFNIGDEVFWTDVDDGICSGYGIIVDRLGGRGKHRVYVLKLALGGELEAFEHELS